SALRSGNGTGSATRPASCGATTRMREAGRPRGVRLAHASRTGPQPRRESVYAAARGRGPDAASGAARGAVMHRIAASLTLLLACATAAAEPVFRDRFEGGVPCIEATTVAGVATRTVDLRSVLIEPQFLLDGAA